jgi:hypothetical protein
MNRTVIVYNSAPEHNALIYKLLSLTRNDRIQYIVLQSDQTIDRAPTVGNLKSWISKTDTPALILCFDTRLVGSFLREDLVRRKYRTTLIVPHIESFDLGYQIFYKKLQLNKQVKLRLDLDTRTVREGDAEAIQKKIEEDRQKFPYQFTESVGENDTSSTSSSRVGPLGRRSSSKYYVKLEYRRKRVKAQTLAGQKLAVLSIKQPDLFRLINLTNPIFGDASISFKEYCDMVIVHCHEDLVLEASYQIDLDDQVI